jgi:hypothetical protein
MYNNIYIEKDNDASEIIAYILIFIFILVSGIIIIIYFVKKYQLRLFNAIPPSPIPEFKGKRGSGIFDDVDDVDLSGNCSKRPLYDSDFFKKIYNDTDNTLVFY